MEKETHDLSLNAPPAIASEDARLVQQCLSGDENAWNELIDRYKRLIYSVPVKQGLSPQDAQDIFQAVCVDLFTNLDKLRKVESLRSWLITVATHKCYHVRRQHRGDVELDALEQDIIEEIAVAPNEMLQELEQEQMVRDAVKMLPARCAELVRLLFFEQPPLPYNELARRLGLATGSIGFIRGRCLNRLQKILSELGF